jgi:hypothetical protein
MSRIRHWFGFTRNTDWNRQGVIVGLVLLGLLYADLALLGHTTDGYVGAGVIVVVSGVGLRFGTWPRWLHR